MKSIIQLFLLLSLCVVSYAQDDIDKMVTESSEPLEDFYIDDVVSRRLISENRVLAYDHVREADIAWSKKIWRVIDVREKMNLPFRNVDKYFIDILREHVENGDIKGFEGDDFKTEILADKISGMFASVDTQVYYNEETYEEEVKIFENDLNPDDFKRFRVKEIWFFDEEASRMKVRILGIAPLREVFDDNGEFFAEIPLFWVYYPEAREYFAKHRVRNGFNDNSPMTWMDLFDKRFFASYIYRESNSLGLSLRDMYPGDENGIVRLLESEKIKNELFNFEHDLWEY